MPNQTFAELPAAVEHLFTGRGSTLPGLPGRADRVLLVLLDAFGRRFLDAHADDHPLLRRLVADGTVIDLATQFPSTTAAHITTVHTGLPVARHGLYEWNVHEPTLDAIITPLKFSFAGDDARDTLKETGLDPRDLLPDDPTLYERLAAEGVVSLGYQPAAFSPSTYDGVVLRGADLRPYDDLGDAVRDAARSLAALERGYAYVYFDGIDTRGHADGPSSQAFDATVRAALDAVAQGLAGAPGDILLMLTADHGMVDVDPERTLWLDDLHPPLARMRLRPAGSARDVFLHVDDVEGTVAALRDHVEVHAVTELLAEGAFGPDPSPRLLDRLASVCVLPPPGRMAWVRGAVDVQASFRGHHGGRTPEESRTYVAALQL